VIFRAAHTLKGAAGAIGHVRMTELTHSMETVLDGPFWTVCEKGSTRRGPR